MRTRGNLKTHKVKKDPYQILLRLSGILAITVVVGFGIFFLCRTLIQNEHVSRFEALQKQNIEAEQEFTAQMNALRASHEAANMPQEIEEETGERPVWEKEIDGSLWRIEYAGRGGLENVSVMTMERAALINGGLLLVNEWHSLPYDFSDAELLGVGATSGYKIQVTDSSVRLMPAAYDGLAALIADAETAGLKDYIVREGYRTNDEQTEMFTKVQDKLSKDYSGDILIAQTKKQVNYPGTSDYQSGMSFRMDLYPLPKGVKFQQSDQGKWFTENAWKQGVAIRFPTADFPNANWEDKSYKTGVSVAMNLYRYVGKAHAVSMRIMDYCLEEYVEFLQNYSHVCIYQDGALRYEVVRIPATEELQSYDVPVPNPASGFQASFDNMGGIVMAYTYSEAQ